MSTIINLSLAVCVLWTVWSLFRKAQEVSQPDRPHELENHEASAAYRKAFRRASWMLNEAIVGIVNIVGLLAMFWAGVYLFFWLFGMALVDNGNLAGGGLRLQ